MTPAPGAHWWRMAVVAGTTAEDVAVEVTRAVRQGDSVEVEAASPEGFHHALAGIAAARCVRAHEGREIALAPSFAGDDEMALRLRVLLTTLSAGQLHERIRAQLEDLVGGDSPLPTPTPTPSPAAGLLRC